MTTSRRPTLAARLRTTALAAVLAATSFIVTAAPGSRPADTGSSPFEGIVRIANELFAPKAALAAYCASNPTFTGYLTASTSSHPQAAGITDPDLYAWVSNVDSTWSCTAFYRFDGVAWNTTASAGRFDWGLLITSTSVACNYDVGSNDYIKGNGTTDCPDTDAEYALQLTLTAERVYQQDVDHDSVGDLSFVHSDCSTAYGNGDGEKERGTETAPENFNAGNVDNRPGANCDPLTIDPFGTSQTITYDKTAPTGTSVLIAGGAAYATSPTVTLTTAANGGVSGMGQMQFNNEGGAWSTPQAYSTNPTWTLSAGDGTKTVGAKFIDANGNPSAPVYDTIILDTTKPAGSVLIAGGAGYATSPGVTLTLSGSDANGVTHMRFSNTGNGTDWQTFTYATSFTPWTLAAGEGTRTVHAQFKDPAGTWGPTPAATDTIIVDTTPASPNPPEVACSGPVDAIWQQALNTPCYFRPQAATSLTLTATTADTVSGIAHIRFENLTPATNWTPSPVLPNQDTSPPYTQGLGFTAATGSATIAVIARNGAGLDGAARTISLVADATAPTAAITSPVANGAPAGPTIPIVGSASDTQTFKEYQVEVGAGAAPATWTNLGTFTTPVTAGTLATWSPGSASGAYTIRLTVRDRVGNTSVAQALVYLENARRGVETYHTRVPFDLGGGWGLDVGVANGEARLSRDLFSIPSFGPSQELSLSYSSIETGSAGAFGVGWMSNLTQYLSFESGFVVWHRADGGRVPFGNIAGTWTPPDGHFETLAIAGSETTITTKDQARYVFESSGAGRLRRIENRFGKALTIVWSASGATVTDASGRGPAAGQTYNLAYDSANARISSFTDYAGRTWTFGYTGTGTSSDLTCISDPESKVTRLGYTAHALTSIVRGNATCASGGTTTWAIAYTSGKVSGITSPEVSHPDLFTYVGDITTWRQVFDDATSPTYSDTRYDLTPVGRVEETAQVASDPDAGAATTDLILDADGNVTEETTLTDAGLAEVDNVYDARGNLVREERVLTRSPLTTVVTRYTYSATNDLLTRTDADNDAANRTVTLYAYDAAGHLIAETRNCTSSGTTIPGEGQGGACTGAGTKNADTNVITRYAYTANDQLAAEQDPLGRVTKHLYDDHGNETAVIANCTSEESTPPSSFESCATTNGSDGGTHDAQTNVLSTTAYDLDTTAGKAGLPTSTTDALGRTTTLTYDALGRQLTETLPGDASIPVLIRTTTYNEYGNALTETDSWTPQGGTLQTRTTTHTYDREQRETAVVDPTGQTRTVTTFDPQGNATSTTVTNVAGTLVASVTTRTFYPTALVKQESGSGSAPQEMTYEAGAIETVTSGDGTTELDYRLDGAATSSTTSDSGGPVTTETVELDTLAREKEIEGPDADAVVDTVNTYDRLGRILTSTSHGATTTYTYDRAGNQLTVTDPVGIVTTTTYDPLNRVTVVIANDVATPSGPVEDITTRTHYDAAGNTIALTDARGVTTRSILNVRDQTSRTIANCTDAGTTPTTNPAACTGAGSHTNGANVITDTTYDGQGNATRTVSAVGLAGFEATTETAYDAAERVQAVKDPMGTITRSVYNSVGQLTDSYANCTTSGTYIPTDWADCTGGGTADGTHNVHTGYTYDAAGNQATVTAPNGRVTTSIYDAQNRLVQTIDNDVASPTLPSEDIVTTYVYDDLGRQAAVIRENAEGTSTVVTRTVFNPDGSVAQTIENCVDSPVGAPERCTGTGAKDAATNLITTNTHDARGQLVAVEAPDPSATTGGSTATITTQYAYDLAGRLCRVVENTTANTNLQTLANPCSTATQDAATTTANVSTRYTYDGAGNLASMIDAAGNTTSYAYDAAGHSTGRTDALGASLVWTYDDLGNRITQRNRTDSVLTNSVVWTYDPSGRNLARIADGATTAYTYDLAGNKLTAAAGGMTITATYDRLNRVLTVDDEDAGTTADTSYTYHLTSPTWTDPSGSYAATLDAFDRATVLDDPASPANFTWSYGTGGEVLSGTQGNGNTLVQSFDAAGHLLERETRTGATSRAHYVYAYNRAGQVLSEDSTVTGDPANGPVTYGYDPLGQLKSQTIAGTTTAYGWDATTNRTSVKVGEGTAATTAYDAANRPTSGADPTATYTSDEDGRLTASPDQTMTWDHLGRLTAVRDAAGTTTIAAYTYDPLDRLRTVAYTDGSRIRFRYTGLTTSAAQWWDDVAGTVTRSIGNGWTGERMLDWTGTGSDRRTYGSNLHHDITWLAADNGTVSGSLRYDPWGTPRSAIPQDYTPFRFQGSWHDASTDLAWVVTRWYAPAMGRFISEDSLLGEPREPDSRHLYAYAVADPILGWDQDGRRVSWPGFGRPMTYVREEHPVKGNKSWGKFAYLDGGWQLEGYAENNNVIAVGASSFTTKVTADRDYLSWKLRLSAAVLGVGGETWKMWVVGSPWVSQLATIEAELFRTRQGQTREINWRWQRYFTKHLWSTAMGAENGSFARRPAEWSYGIVTTNQKCTAYARGGVACERDRSNEIYKGDVLQVRVSLKLKLEVYGSSADGWMFVKGLSATLANVDR